MSSNLEAKKQVVADIVEKLKNSECMMVVSYSGLTVEQVTELLNDIGNYLLFCFQISAHLFLRTSFPVRIKETLACRRKGIKTRSSYTSAGGETPLNRNDTGCLRHWFL